MACLSTSRALYHADGRRMHFSDRRVLPALLLPLQVPLAACRQACRAPLKSFHSLRARLSATHISFTGSWQGLAEQSPLLQPCFTYTPGAASPASVG